MITAKSAKKKMEAIKSAAVEQVGHITTNEKIAGAAAIGAVVGAVATAIGSSMLRGSDDKNAAQLVKKPTA
jgi:hypothetical protein